ncbi:MAG: caspase family protein [Prevotella sp.]|nr:caspase family protein [Prevotella sp.]MBP3842445.1 caspase family protein [Prevotella sp.]
MKRFYVFLMIIATCISGNSQTLHGLVFANTKNPGIGASVQHDYDQIMTELRTIANFIGYRSDIKGFKDTPQSFSRNSLEKAINELSCGPQDIVFFYYSGHGGRSAYEKTKFPQMELIVDGSITTVYQEDYYPLYNIKERIMAKCPRLTIVMGDMCNSIANGLKPKSIASDKKASLKSDAECEFYKDLFVKVKGYLISTSSDVGEKSAAYPDGSGSAFTLGFSHALQKMISNNDKADWVNLMELSIKETKEINNQTPIYEFDLQKADSPTGTLTGLAATTSSTTSTVATGLDKTLNEIADFNSPAINRIKKISSTLTEYFSSPNAKIEVVGKDGNTIVSTKTAYSYLNNLSIMRNMSEVIVVNSDKGSDGKINYLKVHEIYNR